MEKKTKDKNKKYNQDNKIEENNIENLSNLSQKK